jgi:hypothetical protein
MLFSFPQLFLAWVFVCALAAALVFFFLSFKKIQVLSCVGYKNHDKKVRATPHSSPPLGLLAVPLRRGFGGFG